MCVINKMLKLKKENHFFLNGHISEVCVMCQICHWNHNPCSGWPRVVVGYAFNF